jgi:enoyl-CoA hydratase/carnithine racemase
MARFGPAEIRPWVAALGGACDELDALPKVTIAAINGFALGGGCELALACDLRYASSDAQIGQPEILIGVIPGAGGTQRMPRLVGAARAKDLILSGRQLDAAEAERIGLVTRVFDSEDVLDAAIQDARGYARGPAVALATAKDAIRAAENGLRSGLDAEREAFCALFGTRDQKEGMAAFLEKRPPEFDGR